MGAGIVCACACECAFQVSKAIRGVVVLSLSLLRLRVFIRIGAHKAGVKVSRAFVAIPDSYHGHGPG